jgi:hypothetical protein
LCIKFAAIADHLFGELFFSVRKKMIHRAPGSLGFGCELPEAGAGITLGAKQPLARAQQSILGL